MDVVEALSVPPVAKPIQEHSSADSQQEAGLRDPIAEESTQFQRPRADSSPRRLLDFGRLASQGGLKFRDILGHVSPVTFQDQDVSPTAEKGTRSRDLGVEQ